MNSFLIRRAIGLASVGALLLALLTSLSLVSPAQSAQASPAHRAQLQATAHPNLKPAYSLRIWVGSYSCLFPDGYRPCYEVRGDGATPHGVVWVGRYQVSDGALTNSWTTSASSTAYYAVRTGRLYCTNSPYNAYFQAYDYTTGRWSARAYVGAGCAAL